MKQKLFLFCVCLMSVTLAYAQTITVTGTVTDGSNAPLPGVNVIEKGTSNGSASDFDGNFSVTVKEGATLMFSSLGYVSQEITVGNEETLNITLQEDAAALDEVVVVGYGTQRKADVTGAAVRVNTETTENLPNINVLQSLKGQVAGLTVGTPDRPGEEPGFRIRGTNSISVSNTPLVVLDGIIYSGSLNNISNSDIASVDVLKDASAAAVYGSRSAN